MIQRLTSVFNNTYLKFTVIWLVVFLIGLHVRLYPLRNYAPEAYSERASLYIVSKLKEKIDGQITQKYPAISETERSFLSKKMFDEIFHRERENIRTSIQVLTKEFEKNLPEGRKYPYLLASDAYYYLYLTKQIIEKGSISPEIKGSKYFHPLMFAPKGFWEPITLHPYTGYIVYQWMKLFNPSVDLMYAVSFASIMMTAFILFFFLILCRILNFSWISTFIGSIFFILMPIFVKRSTFAWYDNDTHNVLFPILIFIFLFLGLKHVVSKKLNISFAILTSIFLLFYALFWQGWVFVFCMIFLCAAFILAYQFFYLKDRVLSFASLKFFLSILLITITITVAAFGPKDFLELFADGTKALSNFITPQLSIWPDLYLSVGELHKATYEQLISLTGGIIVFVVLIVGIVLSTISLIRKKSVNAPLLFILILFSVITMKLTLGAQRFALLCVVPVALMFIHTLDQIILIFHSLRQRIAPNQNPQAIQWINLAAAILLMSIIIVPIKTINAGIASLLNPIYNDTWNKTFEKIKAETPPESIVNTWWPPGHFIKAMADRRVTFDGATINVPQAYWILNVFSSTKEKEALGMLRMLNNSGNDAIEYLQSLGLKVSSGVALLKQIDQMDEMRARMVLQQTLENPDAVNHLLELTHKTPPPSYTLIYNEFAENSLEMGLFGNWNFQKIEEINASPDLQKNTPARGSKDYINFLWDLAGGPTRHSPKLIQINQIDNIGIFDENLRINYKSMEATVDSKKYGQGTPLSLFYLFNDTVVEKMQPQANLPYSVVLFPNESGQAAILMDRKIAQSLIVRLFYFEGKGLKYFEKFSNIADATHRTHILVFKIKWDEFERDLRLQ